MSPRKSNDGRKSRNICARSPENSQSYTTSKFNRDSRGAAVNDAGNADLRTKIVLALFIVLALIGVLRLGYIQIFEGENWRNQAKESRTISYIPTPERGTIYDRDGDVLAISVDASTIYVHPHEVKDVYKASNELAQILGGDSSYYAGIVGDTTTPFNYIVRQIDVEVGETIKEKNIPGVYVSEDTARYYPFGEVGAQVIGIVNQDGIGQTGLELYYDDVLTGTEGKVETEQGVGGIPMPQADSDSLAAVDGRDIALTIDIDLQAHVEQAIAKGQEQFQSKTSSSMVIDSKTGEIYAAACTPGFNANDRSTIETGSETTLSPITSLLEPGSVFKTVSAVSVLESKTMKPEDTIDCPSVIYADEYEVADAWERDDQTFTFEEVLAYSSNVGISLSVEDMGDDFRAFYDSIGDSKFCQLTDVDYPGENSGSLLEYNLLSNIAKYNMTFGQGLSVTPLQLTSYYGALNNDGLWSQPHFLLDIPTDNSRPEFSQEQIIDDKQALEDVNSMLKSVVEYGTGVNAAVEGHTVAGKTSTAQFAENGVYVDGAYNINFVGFLPNSSTDLVCYTGLENVYGGISTGIFSDIMSYVVEEYGIVEY